MKRLIAKSLMLAGGLSLSSQLMALGLGEMTLKSALNQPLNAEVELVDVADLSKWEIKPSLASTEDFDRAGVDRLFFLTKIKFKVEGGKVVLSTREPVTEPFLNFLVELNWPSGRVLREYTVLLDPPVFEEETISSLVVAPRTSESSGVAATEEQSQSSVVSGQRHDWLDKPAQPGTYKVQPNDTLWEIALQNRPDTSVSAQQMMLAIQRQNPEAFIGGNINRLKTHQVLRIPDAEQIDNIRFGQAVAEVERQNQALNAGAAQLDATGRRNTPVAAQTSEAGGEVRLLSADSENAESAGASGDVDGQGSGRQQALENDLAIALETLDKSRLENQELRQRLEALEEQINTLQRLITLKDDQLAGIQVEQAQQVDDAVEAETSATEQVAGIEEAATEMAEDGVTSEADLNQSAAETTENAAEIIAGAASADGQAVADERSASGSEVASAEEVDFNYQEEQQPAVDPAQVAAEEKAREERKARIAAMLAKQEAEKRAQTGFVDSMLQRPELLGGGLAALLLLILGALKLVQKRKAAKQEEEVSEPADVAFSGADVDGAELDDLDFDEDSLAGGDIDVDHDDLNLDGDADLDLGDLEEEVSDFGAVAQTEDAISESDIYIAYGKFEQAVDLLSGAIEQEPSRSDLRLKLLEVFVEMDDADSFAQQEQSLVGLGDREANEQAEQLRSRLSAPVALGSLAAADSLAADGSLALDENIPSLDDTLGDEFSDGLDFGDALDLSESDDDQAFDLSAASDNDDSASLDFDLGDSADDSVELSLDANAADDIPSLDEEASLEDVPTLDLGDNDSLAFDLDSESVELDISNELSDDVSESAAADNSLEFDLGDLAAGESDESLSDLEESVADVSDGNELEFDLGSLADESDADDADDFMAALDLDESEDPSLDMDLASLESATDDVAELPVVDAAEETEASEDNEVLDLSAELAELDNGSDESDAELADLESLMDAEGSVGDSELPDLSFDLEDGTGFAESEDDDLKSLEAELDSVAEQDVEPEELLDLSADLESLSDSLESADDSESELEDLVSADTETDFSDEIDLGAEGNDDVADSAGASDLLDGSDEEMDFASDLADLDAELEDFEAPLVDDDLLNNDVPVVEDQPEIAEVPVLEPELTDKPEALDDVPVIEDEVAADATVTDAEQDIDLEQLAAAEDEFDFLAGTDECATKLDLARAYIDMEDADGARELLQEVMQEGSDQQKQDARDLMDNLS